MPYDMIFASISAQRDDDLKRYLENGGDPNFSDEERRTLLIHVAEQGNMVMAQLLLDHKADIDQADAYGDTPLMIAADSGHHDLVDLFLNKGATIGKTSIHGDTAYAYAASSGHAECLDILLKHSTTFIDDANNYHDTPLLQAIHQGKTDTVKTLIHHGVNLDLSDHNSVTPLMHAVMKGSAENVKLLLDAGADTTLKNTDGKTAMGIVCAKADDLEFKNYDDILDYLVACEEQKSEEFTKEFNKRGAQERQQTLRHYVKHKRP